MDVFGTKFYFNAAGSSPSFVDGELSKNQGKSWGGALFLGSDPLVNTAFQRQRGKTHSKIVRVEFDGNNATTGGAISCIHVSELSMISTQFTNNSGFYGGALHVASNGDRDPQQYIPSENYVSGQNTLFVNNKAYINGGALFLHVGLATATLDRAGISPLYISNVTSNGFLLNNNEDDIFFESCKFRSNYGSTSGGAWHIERGRAGCRDCIFDGNLVNKNVGIGGAVSMQHQSAFHARRLSMTTNGASNGGAIFSRNSVVDIVNASIIGNMAEKNGGGLYIYVPEKSAFQFSIFARVNATNIHQNKARVGGRSLRDFCFSQGFTNRYVP